MTEKPHRTVEHWHIPQAQMNVSSALYQRHHGPLMKCLEAKYVVRFQTRVEEYEYGLVGRVDGHLPWDYARHFLGSEYDSLGGLKVRGRRGGETLYVAEQPLE